MERVFASAASSSQGHLQKSSDVFWRTKSVLLTKSADSDASVAARNVCAVAESHMRQGQHSRAFALLKHDRLHMTNLACMHRAALCLVAMRDWVAVKELLGDQTPAAVESTESDPEQRRQLLSGLSFLRGRLNQSLQNGPRAAEHYDAALMHDPLNYGAIEMLGTFHLLTPSQETQLVARIVQRCKSLSIPGGDVIGALYTTQLSKFITTPDLSAAFAALESHGLRDDLDVRASYAESLFYRHALRDALTHTSWVIARDAHHQRALLVHLAVLYELGQVNDIFLLAHSLVDNCPEQAISWYAVGVYNLAAGKYNDAKRYFSKSTVHELDRDFPAGWIGFGHAFSLQREHDPAISAYSTAARLYQGCHLPLVFLGMEYQRMSDMNKCDSSLQLAFSIAPSDYLTENELGVKHYRLNNTAAALLHFRRAIGIVEAQECHKSIFYALLLNAAYAHRRLGNFAEAEALLYRALLIDPKMPAAHALLGLVHHEQDRLIEAIECYHRALAVRADDPPTTILLSCALQEFAEAEQSVPEGPTWPTEEEDQEEEMQEDEQEMDMDDVSMELE